MTLIKEGEYILELAQAHIMLAEVSEAVEKALIAQRNVEWVKKQNRLNIWKAMAKAGWELED